MDNFSLSETIQHPALYSAFDLYPSAKGAATHIKENFESMIEHFGGGLLYVLGNQKLPAYQREESFEILRFSDPIPNYLDRALAYSSQLFELLQDQKQLKICHFRDIWSGLPIIARAKSKNYRTLFELNGLPSIELPYRYKSLTQSTLAKIREYEQFCLLNADHILTPSFTLKENLIKADIPEQKITVISNGAYIPTGTSRPINSPSRYLLYFGALQSWQGIDTLLKAFAGLADYDDLKLVICGSNRPKYARPFQKLATRLGLEERVDWHFQLSKIELNNWIVHAEMTIAPLKACSRNLDQGCSPLKILESISAGTTVVASDIPPVGEVLKQNETGKLVRPDRPAELSRAIRFLLDYPEENQRISKNALKLAESNFLWPQKRKELKSLYETLIKG